MLVFGVFFGVPVTTELMSCIWYIKPHAVLTLREEPAAGFAVRTKRLPDMVPAELNMLRQPGPDMAVSMGIMTASTGAVTPGSTWTIWLPWLSIVVGKSRLRLFLLGAL